MSINGQECTNDDEEHGGGIGSARSTFNLIPNIRNQRRSTKGFDDTSDEEADLGEYANPHDKQRGGRQWQPNYRGDDEYKLKVDISNINGDLNIEGFLDWLIEVDMFFDYIEFPCEAPKPGGPLTTRQPAEYKWRSGYPTPL